jgi:hypothetical protein
VWRSWPASSLSRPWSRSTGETSGARSEDGFGTSIDQWALWSAARAAIVRGATGPTWWIPLPVDIVPSAVGERLVIDGSDWRLREGKRVAALGAAMRSELPAATGATAPVVQIDEVERTAATDDRKLSPALDLQGDAAMVR